MFAADMLGALPSLQLLRGGLDGFAYADVGAAAADVAAHRLLDVGVVRARLALEERDRGHYLPALAVAALHHVALDPRVLHDAADGVIPHRLYRHHGTLSEQRDGQHARARRDPVHVNGARAARADAAAVLRARHVQVFAQDPQQRRGAVN